MESVKISLDSSTLILDTESEKGYMNANASYYRFYNINLQQVMGDMYKKYEKFNLKLINITSNGGNLTASYRAPLYFMKGFNFINTWNGITGNENEWVPLQPFMGNQSTSINTQGTGYNIRRSDSSMTIEFVAGFVDFLPLYPPNEVLDAFQFPRMVFEFLIEPVIEGEKGECAVFCLSTNNTLPGKTFNLSGNAIWNDITFNNIDLKKICGEMWYKYSNFEMRYLCFSAGKTTTSVPSFDCNYCLSMSGLDWTNNLTMLQGQQYINDAFMGMSAVINGTSGALYSYTDINNTGVCFQKGKEIVDLRLKLMSLNASGLNVSNQTVGSTKNFIHVFQIVPVNKYNPLKATLWLAGINGFPGSGTAPAENNVGILVTSNYSDLTYKRINLGTLLRGMFNKTKKYAIFYEGNLNVNTGGTATNTLTLNMYGLNFQQQYDSQMGLNNIKWCVGGNSCTRNAMGYNFPSGNQSTCFYPTSEVVDIRLTATLPDTGLQPTALEFPNAVGNQIVFSIMEVE
jgi:hypothetical protein